MINQPSDRAAWKLNAKLSTISNQIGLAGIYLPFVAVLALAADKPIAQLGRRLGLDNGFISNFSILRTQYNFMVSKGFAAHLTTSDFWIFEAFIWIACITAVARILTGLCSPDVLSSHYQRLKREEREGKSTLKFLISLFLVGLVGVFLSLNFDWAYNSGQARFLMQCAPSALICAQVLLFCGSVFFLTSGLMCLVSLVFARKPRALGDVSF